MALFGEPPDPEAFANAAVSRLHDTFPRARVSLVRPAPDGGLIVQTSLQPPSLPPLAGVRLFFRRPGTYLASLAKGSVAVVEDAAEWAGAQEPPRAKDAPPLPLVDVPLRNAAGLLGFLRLETDNAAELTAELLAALVDAAELIALGLDRLAPRAPAAPEPIPPEQRRAEERVRALEEALRHAQKMEAVGRLAGGVAHDFNNLLTAILGNGHILLGETPPSDPRHGALAEIVRAAERAAALTGRLLAFSRKQVMSPNVLDLNAVVADVDAMLRRLIGEDVILTIQAARPLFPVSADAGQLQQVLVNLVVNARDAMPGGGRLTVSTGNAVLGAEAYRLSPDARAGSWAVLSVRDTGTGMDEETVSHLFEPFFTTKEPGRGTGLGLSTAYGIVKQSGGFLAVETAPGKGSTFRVYLPSAGDAEPKPPSSAAHPRVRPAGGGSETILLVEDEPAVRSMAAVVLRARGYIVLEASDGSEALALAEGWAAAEAEGTARPIDLLLTDVVMPRLSGPDLAGRLVASRPGLRVLFISGYMDHGPLPKTPSGDEAPFLQKPFAPELLLSRVRATLE